MGHHTLIKNANIVNEGKIFKGSVFIFNEKIHKIFTSDQQEETDKIQSNYSPKVIDASGKFLLPGVIDDQVHFREPGLTHKADIYTESKAAVAGGITSYMEMPNTFPQTTTIDLLEQKYEIASQKSLANYSFYLGATNDNLKEVNKLNPKNVCGLKIFMGSSTGNMLVNDKKSLEGIFAESHTIIATHCEDEQIIKSNLENCKIKYGENIPIEAHPLIRNAEACYRSSGAAVDLALKYNSRLHILHISTARELSLFESTKPASNKKITAEACVHHLWFSDEDYKTKKTFIKWNPAIKTKQDRESVFQALHSGKIDVIASDHAPHTLEEKQKSYLDCPSGGPLVQHTLIAMLEFYHQKKINLEKIAEKMSHAVADCFQIEKRGYIRENYWADLVLVDLNNLWTVKKENILYKCAWSPLEEQNFHSKITHTFVNGNLVYQNNSTNDIGEFNEAVKGQRILFSR
jgi:dihydroorotase